MIRVSSNADKLIAALRRFTQKALPEGMETATRKVAFDVVAETTRRITTGPPKRVDTGRYRAAWRAGAAAAGLPTSGLPDGPDKTGDGYGDSGRTGDTYRITVGNAVEYAAWVEFGTDKMAPGNHLSTALIVVRRGIPGDSSVGSIQLEIANAWSR